MTKKFFTLLVFPFFFIAVAFTSGCSSPIGSLLVAGPALDYIRAEPNRFLYSKYDLFIPVKHMEVFGIFGGKKKPIDIDKVEIKIIENPGMTGEKEVPVKDNHEGLVLEFEGIKKVVITSGNMETYYHIEVGEPGTGDDSKWSGSGGGSGIVIYWPKPPPKI